MSKIIKTFRKLSHEQRLDLYTLFSSGELERTTFPFEGALSEGVIYTSGEHVYLVPISSIVQVRSTHTDALEKEEILEEVEVVEELEEEE